MNWFDIFVVILLLRTSYIGFKNGLTAEIYKAAGLAFSGLAAFYFYKKLVSIIDQYMITMVADSLIYIISFLFILLSGVLLFKFVFMFINKVIQLSFAEKFSKTVGLIFGIARGVLIACLVYVILNWTAVDYLKESIQEKSFSGPYIEKINTHLNDILVRFKPE